MNRSHTELDGHGVHVTGWDEGGGQEGWREADPMGTLTSAGAASRHLSHLVSEHLIAFNWQTGQGQYEPNEHTSGTLHQGQVPAVYISPVIPFAQNTRGEVRIVGESEGGHIAGSLAAQAGTKQQTHLFTSCGIRRLTPVECARLQGFPDEWNDHLSDTQRYKQYGNAVCVNVAEWIGRNLAQTARETT